MILTDKFIAKKEGVSSPIYRTGMCEYHVCIQDQYGDPVDLMDCSLELLDAKKGMIKIIRHMGR